MTSHNNIPRINFFSDKVGLLLNSAPADLCDDPNRASLHLPLSTLDFCSELKFKAECCCNSIAFGLSVLCLKYVLFIINQAKCRVLTSHSCQHDVADQAPFYINAGRRRVAKKCRLCQVQLLLHVQTLDPIKSTLYPKGRPAIRFIIQGTEKLGNETYRLISFQPASKHSNSSLQTRHKYI